MKTLIIQNSPQHTASTVLINALHGFIEDLNVLPVCFVGKNYVNLEKSYWRHNIILIKSHSSIDSIIKMYGNKYKLFFVCSERCEKKNDIYMIDNKYRKYENVLIFDYNELNETENNSLNEIVENMYTKLSNFLPNINLNKTLCIQRIKNMNYRYQQIKHLPFSFQDNFFHIHGSHRNRKDNDAKIN